MWFHYNVKGITEIHTKRDSQNDRMEEALHPSLCPIGSYCGVDKHIYVDMSMHA